MGRKTLEDISQLTGISKAVISRVLSGKAAEYRISKATVERVLRVCEEEQYRPNYLAQLLRGQASKTIGLILPRLDYEFFGKLSSTIIAEAHRHGYTVITMLSLDDPQQEAEAIDTLISRQVEGIIISPSSPSSELLREVSQELPLVQIDRYFEDEGLSYVSTNNYEGARTAVKYLADMGHKNVLCLQAELDVMPIKERVRGVLDAAREYGINLSVSDDLTEEKSFAATMEALNSPQPPTAIFSLSLHCLSGAVLAINKKGMFIRDDISLITFDESRLMDYTRTTITRVVQPVEKMCTAAFQVLSQSITEKKPCQERMLIEPVFLERTSVKRLL